MPWAEVEPVIDPDVRLLCVRRYPGHRKGCPNFGKKPGCPPSTPMLGNVLDLARPLYAIWNVFDFGAHVERMRERHPAWSARQLACCLYWQGMARKALAAELTDFMWEKIHVVCQGYTWDDFGSRSIIGTRVLTCPEAHGVNVTETMRSLGHELEWPPVTVAYQVALAGLKGDK